MSDRLQRFLFEESAIRGELVQLEEAWAAILERRDYPVPVRQVLGEMVAASMLLVATLKFDGSLTMQVQGDGPINLMVVEATSKRTLRGLAHWRGEVPESDLAAQFGAAKLAITIEPDKGSRYQGVVMLEGARLARALEKYLLRSEQLESHLILAADEQRAAGFLLQRMPGDSGEEENWQRIGILGSTLSENELLHLGQQDILHRLFHEESMRLFETEPVTFYCSCSRERITEALRQLGHDEVMDIIAQEKAIEVDCEFCNKHYHFDAVDAEQIFTTQPQPSFKPTRH